MYTLKCRCKEKCVHFCFITLHDILLKLFFVFFSRELGHYSLYFNILIIEGVFFIVMVKICSVHGLTRDWLICLCKKKKKSVSGLEFDLSLHFSLWIDLF